MSTRLSLLGGQARAAVVVAALSLVACATPQQRPGLALDGINDELKRAASERKPPPENIDRALMPPLKIDPPRSAQSTEPRFDLSVVDAPAAQVFMALVSSTRYSMLLPPELSGKITVSLKDVTLLEALESIRELYGYDFKLQGTRIFIQPNALQSRVFQINYLSGNRQGSSDLRVTSSSVSAGQSGSTSGIAPGTTGISVAAAGGAGLGGVTGTGTRATETSRVSMSSDSDFWRDFSAALKAIVGSADGRQVIVNQMSGVVVVRAFPADIRNVETYLKATQVVVERQVMLEAKIIEVTLNRSAQSGINWSLFGTPRSPLKGHNPLALQAGIVTPGTTLTTRAASGANTIASADVSVTPGALGAVTAAALGQGFIGLAFQTSNFAALISFLETQGDVAVLSSPRIATLNNQKALLKVGTDELFITNVSGGTTATTTIPGTAPSLTLQPYFSGISLDVTPQVDDDGNIILHVHPAVSSVTDAQKIIDLGAQGIFKLPLAASTINETDSIVRVRDGNIVAIGGLMRQKQQQGRSQLPGVGDVPVVGALTGQRNSDYSKSEMVILMKPTIINSDKLARDDLLDLQGRIQELDPRRALVQSSVR